MVPSNRLANTQLQTELQANRLRCFSSRNVSGY